MCVSQSPCLWSHTLVRMCTCISTWIYVYLTPHVWSSSCMAVCMAVCLYPRYLISVPTPCLECVHVTVHIFMSTLLPILAQPPMVSYIEGWVPCVSLCVCPSHRACGPTPCLECVHASVHVIMCTWLTRSGPDPMHNLMETWVPLNGSVFVSLLPHLFPHLV